MTLGEEPRGELRAVADERTREGTEGTPPAAVETPEAKAEGQARKVPETIPLLPVRDVVIYPFMILPLFVGRERSVRAVDESLSRDRLILLVAQRDAEKEDPGSDEILSVGTVAMIMRMLKIPDGRVKVDRKSTRLNSSHIQKSRMPSSA